jgi:hypothetical protein
MRALSLPLYCFKSRINGLCLFRGVVGSAVNTAWVVTRGCLVIGRVSVALRLMELQLKEGQRAAASRAP